MTITIYSTFLLIISLLTISIYLYNIIRSISKKNSNPIVIVFIAFNVVMLVWSISFAFFHFSIDPYSSKFWYKIGAVGYCLFIPLMFHLSLLIFLQHKIMGYRWSLVLAYIIGLMFVITYVESDLMHLQFIYIKGVWNPITLKIPVWYVLYLLYFMICVGICFTFAIKGYISQSKDVKRQGKIMLISIVVCSAFGLFVNVIAPWLRLTSVPAICDMGIVIYLYTVRYIIEHYDLINICPEIVATDILERIDDMVFLTDAEGRIIYSNESATSTIKYNPRYILGKNISIVIGDNAHVLTKDITEVSSEIRIYTSEGEPVPVRISISPIMCMKNSVGKLYVFHDLRMLYQLGQEVSQKQTLANTVIAANEKLTELDKLKSDFICNISHELRTPLNLITSSLQLMNNKSESTGIDLVTHRKCFSVILQNTYRLTRLINNIIDTTRIDAGYLNMYHSNNDIVHFLEDIVDGVRMYAQEKCISITFDTDIEEKIIAFDTDKIERVFLNLLSNAIKFTNKGGDISVVLKDGTDFIEISVVDTGIGISKQDQEIIFDRFIQADKSLARNCEGSGIGLSLVKALVEMHHGQIRVESELNKGSTFTVALPVYQIEQDGISCIQYRAGLEKQRVNIEFSDIYL